MPIPATTADHIVYLDKSLTAPTSGRRLEASPTQALGTGTHVTKSQKSINSKEQPWDYRHKRYRPHKNRRIRVELPSLEHYEKELEFHALAPNRVVVRLERLMGTDRVRITDPKYMATLLNQLESTEQKQWLKRSAMRKQKEANRARILAIEGIMEPTPDMKNLMRHPVFRVNRILNRIQKMDLLFFNHSEENTKLPPIKSVEPFVEQAKTGILFGFHPMHYRRTAPPASVISIESYTKPSTIRVKHPSVNAAGEVVFDASLSDLPSTTISHVDSLEWGGEDYDNVLHRRSLNTILKSGDLDEVKEHYGISVNEELDAIWKRHQSPLIQMLYDADKDGTTTDLYNFGTDVIETYQREVRMADHFLLKHRREFAN